MNKEVLTSMNKEVLTTMNKEVLATMNKEVLTSMNKEVLTSMNKEVLTTMNKDIFVPWQSVVTVETCTAASTTHLSLYPGGPSMQQGQQVSEEAVLVCQMGPAHG